MNITTKEQDRQQTEGPHRPTAEQIGLMLLRKLAPHVEIRAISINGQTGRIVVETRHEDLEQTEILNP